MHSIECVNGVYGAYTKRTQTKRTMTNVPRDKTSHTGQNVPGT